jgi:3-dehydroquinate synthase
VHRPRILTLIETDEAPATIHRRPTVPTRMRWAAVVGLAVLVSMLPFLILGDRVERWLDHALAAAATGDAVAVLVLSALGLDSLLPIPSSVLATVAAAQLGFVRAMVVIALGLTLGNALGYLIGALFGAPMVDRLVGSAAVARAKALLDKQPGTVMLAVTRAVPVLSESVMLIAGAARAPIVRTIVICGLANLGIAIVYASVGGAAKGPAAFLLLPAGAIGVPAAAMVATTVFLRRRTHD